MELNFWLIKKPIIRKRQIGERGRCTTTTIVVRICCNDDDEKFYEHKRRVVFFLVVVFFNARRALTLMDSFDWIEGFLWRVEI